MNMRNIDFATNWNTFFISVEVYLVVFHKHDF